MVYAPKERKGTADFLQLIFEHYFSDLLHPLNAQWAVEEVIGG